MEHSICPVCEVPFDFKHDDIAHVKKKGARTLKWASELRGDGKFSSLDLDVDEIDIVVHKICRSKYTHPKNFKTAEKILRNSLQTSTETDCFLIIIGDENEGKAGPTDLKLKAYQGGQDSIEARQDTTEDHQYCINEPKDFSKSIIIGDDTNENRQDILKNVNKKRYVEHSANKDLTNFSKDCHGIADQQDSTQDYQDNVDTPEYLEYCDDTIEDPQETKDDDEYDIKNITVDKNGIKQEYKSQGYNIGPRCTQVCHTCLSGGSRLYLLVRYAQIFNSIIGNNNTKKTYVCGECLEELRKISSFKEKAVNAQKFIEGKWKLQDTSYGIGSRNEDDYTDWDFDDQSTVVKTECDGNSSPTSNGVNQQHKVITSNVKVTKRNRNKQQKTVNQNEAHILSDPDSETATMEPGYIPVDFESETTLNEEENNEIKRSQCKINYTGTNLTTVVKKIRIEPKAAKIWMRKERNSVFFRNLEKKCVLCVSKLQPRESLEQHLANFHKKTAKNHACLFCKIVFKTTQELKVHLEHHYFVLRCTLCGYLCYGKNNMNDHLNKHKRSIECLECGLRFEYAAEFNAHYKHHLKCNECGKQFTTKENLQIHIERHHTTQQCKECNKTYHDFNTLRKHKRYKHTIERNEKSFCVSCGIQFDNAFLLQRHLKNSAAHAHERKKARSVTCPECNRVLSSKCKLKDHYISFHSQGNQPTFTCPKCGKQFVFQKHLTTHIKYVHDRVELPRNKICKYCSRGFKTNRQLIYHIRTHTGEKPNKCSFCDAAFAQKTALQTHIKNKHKTEHKSTILSKPSESGIIQQN